MEMYRPMLDIISFEQKLVSKTWHVLWQKTMSFEIPSKRPSLFPSLESFLIRIPTGPNQNLIFLRPWISVLSMKEYQLAKLDLYIFRNVEKRRNVEWRRKNKIIKRLFASLYVIFHLKRDFFHSYGDVNITVKGLKVVSNIRHLFHGHWAGGAL